jgi:hypothetical protein
MNYNSIKYNYTKRYLIDKRCKRPRRSPTSWIIIPSEKNNENVSGYLNVYLSKDVLFCYW